MLISSINRYSFSNLFRRNSYQISSTFSDYYLSQLYTDLKSGKFEKILIFLDKKNKLFQYDIFYQINKRDNKYTFWYYLNSNHPKVQSNSKLDFQDIVEAFLKSELICDYTEVKVTREVNKWNLGLDFGNAAIKILSTNPIDRSRFRAFTLPNELSPNYVFNRCKGYNN